MYSAPITSTVLHTYFINFTSKLISGEVEIYTNMASYIPLQSPYSNLCTMIFGSH